MQPGSATAASKQKIMECAARIEQPVEVLIPIKNIHG
jgi:hypothetical protein